MLKQTLLAVSISLAASSAFAHEIPAPTSGDPYSINMGELVVGADGTARAQNLVFGEGTLAGVMFDVTTAGMLDVFTDDHDDYFQSIAQLYIFKQDADGQDWTLINYTAQAPRVSPTNRTNIYGVNITDWANVPYATGSSDPGVTLNFDQGTYLALAIGDTIQPVGYTLFEEDNPSPAVAAGYKLSTGFSSAVPNYLGIFDGVQGIQDLNVRVTAGSGAAFVPAVEPATVPVPGAVWLMGSVLAGFGAFGRKKAVAA